LKSLSGFADEGQTRLSAGQREGRTDGYILRILFAALQGHTNINKNLLFLLANKVGSEKLNEI
jgi:hypothetical protein